MFNSCFDDRQFVNELGNEFSVFLRNEIWPQIEKFILEKNIGHMDSRFIINDTFGLATTFLHYKMTKPYENA